MAKFVTREIDKRIEESFKTGTPSGFKVLNVLPPEQSGGIDVAPRFISSVHHCSSEFSLLKSKVKSSVFSLEIWYQNEELDFYFVLPAEEEDYYRRQLSGYYEGIDIKEKKLPKDRFIDAERGQAISLTRLDTVRHPIEPLWLASGGGDNENVNDPYKSLINQIDSKTQLEFFLQVLYKPLPENIWSKLYGESIEEYAERLEEEDDVDSKSKRKGINIIKNLIGEPSFLTEIRLFCIGDNPRLAEKELISLTDIIENDYKGVTGQTLKPKEGIDLEDLLTRCILREFSEDNKINFNSKKSLWKRRLLNKVFSKKPSMILTPDEISGVKHLPSSDEVSAEGINYTQALVQGSLPPEAKNFEPVKESEQKKVEGDRK